MKTYYWPGNLEKEMPLHFIKYYSGRGLRFTDLNQPVCWDCGAATKLCDPVHPVVALKFHPYCKECSDKHWQSRMQELEYSFEDYLKKSKEADKSIRITLMNIIRDPGAPSESRILAREIFAGMA